MRLLFWADGPCIVLEPNRGMSRGFHTLTHIYSVAAATLGFGFYLSLVFHRETKLFIVIVSISTFTVIQGPLFLFFATVSISPFVLRAWTSSIQIHFIYIRNFRLHLYCVLSCVRFACRIINRVRLVDSRWSSGVTVVGSESSQINSLDRELSVPQIELIYLSKDHRARLYQLVSASNLTFSRLLTSVSSNPKRLFSGGPQSHNRPYEATNRIVTFVPLSSVDLRFPPWFF